MPAYIVGKALVPRPCDIVSCLRNYRGYKDVYSNEDMTMELLSLGGFEVIEINFISDEVEDHEDVVFVYSTNAEEEDPEVKKGFGLVTKSIMYYRRGYYQTTDYKADLDVFISTLRPNTREDDFPHYESLESVYNTLRMGDGK